MKTSILLFSLLFCLTAEAKITAKSFLVTDTHGEVILERNADQVQPIASITKLMTAMVVLDADQDLEENLVIDYRLSGKYHTRLPRSVKTLPRHTVLNLAIVKSDNLAAYTLCANYPGGVDSCVRAMNAKAMSMQLTNTRYTDPTGLDETNVSTARELAQLVLQASTYKHITDASGMPEVSIKVKKRWWQFGNTNPLVRRGDSIRVSKTGYINASGGCLVMLVDTEVGERVIVLLNSKNTRTRIPEAAKIAVTVSHSDISVD